MILSQVPLGTSIQASGSPSTLAEPWQESWLVPQSFLPALTMPAHFSVACSAAKALWPAAATPKARMPAIAPRMTWSRLLMFDLLSRWVGKRQFSVELEYADPA